VLLGIYTGLVEAGWVEGILLARMETSSQMELMEYGEHYDHQGIKAYSKKNALN